MGAYSRTCELAAVFVVVKTATDAIQFMEEITQRVVNGTASSVNQALIQLNKGRKTIDRFKHIFYLHKTNEELYIKVSHC